MKQTWVLAAMILMSSAFAQTRVTFWGDWGGDGAKQFETMVDAFNASQDDIEVEYVVVQDMITKFLTSSVSGQAPDVMFWDRWRTALYAPRGVLEPIDAWMERDGVSRDLFYAEALRELSYGDSLYGLPLTVDARVLFYNKDAFAEAGLTPPTTWDELATAAEVLTQRDGGKLTRSGLALNDVGLFSMWLRQAGGQMLSDDGTKTAFNSSEGLEVLKYWKSLLDAGVYELGFDTESESGQDTFVTGQVAMTFTGPWMINTYKQYGDDLNFGIIPPPAGPDGDKGTVMGGFGLIIPTAAQNKDAAWEFVKWWLAQPENALKWAQTSFNLPGNVEAVESTYFQDDPYYRPVVEALEFAQIRPPVPGYSPMEIDALIPNLQLFMEGKVSAEEALIRAQRDGDRILAENAQ